ncbi:SMI1/KNR4 family protein [Lysobacteraceae bacterium NML08-0793]|nr:SMI1/KNR4 family protein [Xanthomonadaceae bacterium NML08-0793]
MLKFFDCEKNITEQDIKSIERSLDTSLPKDFRQHYLIWNGGTPNKSIFENENIDYDYIEIREFIPMKYAHEFEDDPDFTLEGRVINEWKNFEVPSHLIPYALDWGGNYICLHKENGKIYYYVRDVWSKNIRKEDNFLKNSICIADSFSDFLSKLKFNPDD